MCCRLQLVAPETKEIALQKSLLSSFSSSTKREERDSFTAFHLATSIISQETGNAIRLHSWEPPVSQVWTGFVQSPSYSTFTVLSFSLTQLNKPLQKSR